MPDRLPLPAKPLVVDDREPPELARLLGAEVRRLAVADVHVGAWGVERKAGYDLVASLLDGRLFAQVEAVQAAGLRPLLVLEGPLAREAAEGGAGRALHAAMGALATLAGPLGVPVVPTPDLASTASFLRALARRDVPEDGVVHVRAPTVKVRRAEPYAAALAQVSGVGDGRARLLAARWPSFARLAEARFFELVDEVGPRAAEALWPLLHGADVPDVYRRLGTGKRARALVARCPDLERGGTIARSHARRIVGPAAVARLGDCVA